ncbi:MAG: hypothetical protein WED83_08180 [Acidimicrobiia bacterium]
MSEDPTEIEQFRSAVINNLYQADHYLLRHAAFDVGDKLWRLTKFTDTQSRTVAFAVLRIDIAFLQPTQGGIFHWETRTVSSPE